MRLIFVHGRSQQGNDPDTMKTEWLAALQEGLQKSHLALPDNVEVRLPFYGDRLNTFAAEFDVPLTEDVNTRGGGEDADFLEFEQAVVESVRQGAGITKEQVDQKYGEIPKPKGPQNWHWVQAILRAIDDFSPGLSGKALEIFTRDVYLYTKRDGVKTEINKIVAAELSEQEPTVIVGHSLGSVVAYSVLRQDTRALQVRSFVTLGCPLGVRPIRNQFAPLKFPTLAKTWYNAYDDKDVVALYPLDGKNFPVKPEVFNNPKVINQTGNHHGISGYLGDSAVSRAIHQALS
jgi:hypothetical protein